MNRQQQCANNKLSGCQNIVVERGNIFCDTCTNLRKNISKSYNNNHIDDIINKNIQLEKELTNKIILFESLESELNKTHHKIEENNLYIKHLEKENIKLTEALNNIRKDNQNITIENETHKLNYKQLKLDNEKTQIYNNILQEQNTKLVKENEDLTKENTNFISSPNIQERNLQGSSPNIQERNIVKSSPKSDSPDLQRTISLNKQLKNMPKISTQQKK